MADETVHVFFYGDYVCPFSYVADARVRGFAEGREGVVLHWRPLSIHPAVPSDGLPVERLGRPPDEQARIRREVRRLAEEEGVPLELPDFVANSHEALQAAEFARDVGEEALLRAHRALFRAYFVEGRNLGRRSVLLDVCEEAGLDREGLEAALEDGRYRDELQLAAREASRYGIEGTPTILFGRHKVVGAAPREVMREALERARRDPSDAGPSPGGGDAGTSAGPAGETGSGRDAAPSEGMTDEGEEDA